MYTIESHIQVPLTLLCTPLSIVIKYHSHCCLIWLSAHYQSIVILLWFLQEQKDKDGEKKPTRVTGRLQTTGRMGEVMKESSSISHTYAQHFLRNVDSNNKILDSATLHMHMPEGTVPKDGPSAGVTMTTSLLPLALKKPGRKDLAMTGELTLTGKVLPVGGIKVTQPAAVSHNYCITHNAVAHI